MRVSKLTTGKYAVRFADGSSSPSFVRRSDAEKFLAKCQKKG